MKEPIYLALANTLADMIEREVYKPGDKLPSIRSLHQKKGLSIGTILQAFTHLMDRGLITSREKSGYFVNDPVEKRLPLPLAVPLLLSARNVHIDQLLQQLPAEGSGKNFVSFTNASPDNRLLPFNAIKRAIQQTSRDITGSYLGLESRSGNRKLREEIAKRSLHWKGSVHADEVIITNGALEAILCCVSAVTRPGDTVLVQDPCFFGLMQILECLHLKIATVPSYPANGLSINDLREVCERVSVKACIFISNFNNPDGASINTADKKALATLAERLQLPIIEDDLYGELFFKGKRPDTIKSYDKNGWVMYCSSFTKTLAPGFRLGWCAAGRFSYDVARIKSMHNHSTCNINQRVILQLLKSGAFDRHLQKFRLEMQKNANRFSSLIEQHFPTGTKITYPAGSVYIWVELPGKTNTSRLLEKAFDQDISYAPGEIFSSKGDYQNCIRLSYSSLWGRNVERALIKLGQLLSTLSEKRSS